ncbi:MAG TPA: hypothetical protein VI006_20470, partial [Solirubrobacteraceae bacterium]
MTNLHERAKLPPHWSMSIATGTDHTGAKTSTTSGKQALDRPHLIGRREVQLLPELGSGRDDVEGQDAAGRSHPAPLHVLRERGHRQGERDLRLGHVGAAAVPTVQEPLAHELVDDGPQRGARHAEV